VVRTQVAENLPMDQKRNEIEIASKEISTYVKFEVKSQQDVEIATQIISVARKLIKVIKQELFEEQIKSAKHTLDMIKKSQDKLIEVPAMVETHLKKQIEEYREMIYQQELEKRKQELKKEQESLEFFNISNKEQEQKQVTEQAIEKEVKDKIIQQQKVEGMITAKRWKAKLVDFNILLKAIVDGEAPVELIQFNQSYADGLARSLKENFNIKGIEAYQEDEIRFKNI